MNPSEAKGLHGSTAPESLLESLAERYLNRLQAGETPDRQALLAQYPEMAEALEQRLQLVEMIHGVADASGAPDLNRPAPGQRPGSTGEESTDFTVREVTPGSDSPSPQGVDDFELLRPLGSGSFGHVFLARQRSLDRLVAVKVSPNQGTEARTLASLEHDHIVRVFSETVEPERDLRILCMQYVPGPTLAGVIAALAQLSPHDWSGRTLVEVTDALSSDPAVLDASGLRDREFLSGCDFVEAVCWMGARLAEALAHAHRQGILHRDIKPANILLHRNGRPLLADFNLASARQPTEPSAGETFGGTVSYMAPEHLDAFNPEEPTPREAVDPRSDVYSLGLVLYELLTGQRPFAPLAKDLPSGEALRAQAAERRRSAPSPRQCRPELPPVLDRVVQRCLEPDPERRYQTAAELAQALEGCRELYSANRAMPTAGLLTRLTWQHPQLMVLLLPLLPHLVGALVVFSYTATWVTSHPARSALEGLFGKLALGYSLVVFPLTGYFTHYLTQPIWRTWMRVQGVGAVGPDEAAAMRHRALRKPYWGVLLSALGWLPGAVVLPLLVVCLVPVPDVAEVFLHYCLSFLIAGLVALTYTAFVDEFLLVCVLYPCLWVDPQHPRPTARAELGTVDRRLRVIQILSGVIPLAAGIALMAGLIGAGPEQRTAAAYQNFLVLVLGLMGLGMAGSWLAVLFSGQLRQALTALTGVERQPARPSHGRRIDSSSPRPGPG